MKPYKKILLALSLENSEDESLLQRAQIFAQTYGAEITLLHVVDMSIEEPNLFAISKRAHVQAERFVSAKKKMHALGECFAIPHQRQYVLEGNIKRVVAATAIRVGADLIIVGKHQRSDLAQLLLGSVAGSIIQNAPCDVFTWQVDAA